MSIIYTILILISVHVYSKEEITDPTKVSWSVILGIIVVMTFLGEWISS